MLVRVKKMQAIINKISTSTEYALSTNKLKLIFPMDNKFIDPPTTEHNNNTHQTTNKDRNYLVTNNIEAIENISVITT